MRHVPIKVLLILWLSICAAAQGADSLPPGTRLRVQMQTRVETKTSHVGDMVEAVLSEPIQGSTALPVGTRLTGRVTQVSAESRTNHTHALLRLLFTEAALPNGQRIQIQAVMQSLGIQEQVDNEGIATIDSLSHDFILKSGRSLWLRVNSVPSEQPVALKSQDESEPPHESTDSKASSGTARLGDLLIAINTIAIPSKSSANSDRYDLSVSGTIRNVGENPVCTFLTAKVETSFKLQESATITIDHNGGMIREMLPGEVADVNFVASIKNGTDPLRLTVSQGMTQQGCGNDSHIIFNTEVSLPITVPPGMNPSGAVHPGAVTPPRVLQKTDPFYPVEAAAGQSGSVVISAIVGADGTVHDPKVIRSLGQGFDEKPLEAVKEWKFDPATKDGRKVAVKVSIEVNFRPR